MSLFFKVQNVPCGRRSLQQHPDLGYSPLSVLGFFCFGMCWLFHHVNKRNLIVCSRRKRLKFIIYNYSQAQSKMLR